MSNPMTDRTAELEAENSKLKTEVERLRKFESRVFHAENQSNTAWRRVENYKKVIRDLKKVAKKALEGGEI